MANIDSYLAKIREAVYGEEVRGSIHDAIQAINTEVVNSDMVHLRNSLASVYSASSAYNVGDYVFYPEDGIIYRCKTAILSPGEAWNSNHWIAVKLADVIEDTIAAIEQDVVSEGNLIPFPYASKAETSYGVSFTTNRRIINAKGTPTGGATFTMFGYWKVPNNLSSTSFKPGYKYSILNYDPLFKIVFFNSSGDPILYVDGSQSSFVVPETATGINIYYQFSGAGSYVDKTYFPVVTDANLFEKEIQSEYDDAVPVRTELFANRVEETYDSGRKRSTFFDSDTVVERMYEGDGQTLHAIRTTVMSGRIITTNLEKING